MFSLSLNRTFFFGCCNTHKKVRMCNKLLDDAFHCHSTCIMLILMLVVLSRINSMILSLFRLWWDSVSSFTLSLVRFHSRRVDFKFIFICLDLSLELFFIPLTISSALKIVETVGWVHYSIVACLSSLCLFLYPWKHNDAHNTHTYIENRLSKTSAGLHEFKSTWTIFYSGLSSAILSFSLFSTSLSLSFRQLLFLSIFCVFTPLLFILIRYILCWGNV